MKAAKEYLMRIEQLDSMINAKIAEVEHLKSMLYRITPVLQQDKVQTSGVADRRADAIAKMIDLNTEIDEAVDRYADQRREAMILMEKMGDALFYNVLVRKYFLHQTWENIADDMKYSYRGICYLHGRALAAFQKILDERKGE